MIVLVALAFATCGALAADQEKEKKEPSPAQQAQREKMKACNAEAKKDELKGDARKAFMSECLGSKSSAANPEKKAKEKASKNFSIEVVAKKNLEYYKKLIKNLHD